MVKSPKYVVVVGSRDLQGQSSFFNTHVWTFQLLFGLRMLGVMVTPPYTSIRYNTNKVGKNPGVGCYIATRVVLCHVVLIYRTKWVVSEIKTSHYHYTQNSYFIGNL